LLATTGRLPPLPGTGLLLRILTIAQRSDRCIT